MLNKLSKLKVFSKKNILLLLFSLIIIFLVIIFINHSLSSGNVFISEKSKKCIDCHRKKNIHTAQILEWEKSKHAKKSVACYECHQAKSTDPDAFNCNGFLISKIVSPADCARCHNKEFQEFDRSHHAKAGEILGSLDNYIGEVVQGKNSSVQGCQSCHGSLVKIDKKGKLDPMTWPNIGIGRLNPDGSKGSCSTCHSKHNFSLAVARSPESCGKCHLGPDHPQKEIYEESIHGRIFFVKVNEMNLDNPRWILGMDYSAAPNCTTCHIGATKDLEPTHDIGERLSFNLREVISKPMKDSAAKRTKMKAVCINCHGPEWIDNFYTQLDTTIALYNESYAKPASEIMKRLKAKGKLTPAPFDEEIEWAFFELWHHEGRRARHGAAMMGPDYVQWNGFYDIAHNFYFRFLPLASKLGEDKFVNDLLSKPEHNWIKNVPPKNLQAQEIAFQKWYKKRIQLLKLQNVSVK